MDQDLISTAEAAKLLAGAPGVPVGTRQYTAKLCREGKLKAKKIGRGWAIEKASVIEFREALEKSS